MTDIVDRLRTVDISWSQEGEWCAEAADEIERLRKAMDVQGNAVKVLHQAETFELNHLRKTVQEAYMAKMTLDSEREANRILTDEIEQLRLANSDLQMWFDYARTECDKLQAEVLRLRDDRYDAALKEKE